MKYAHSADAKIAFNLITQLQTFFVESLQRVTEQNNQPQKFEKIDWLRNNGEWGGGWRFVSANNQVFNSAAVNFSQVQYEDQPQRLLNSATAISTIIHPNNPKAPSVHMHYSYTEYKNKPGFWRLMADLNPSIYNEADRRLFAKAVSENAGDTLEMGLAQGNKYFSIPALGRARGVVHYYLEEYQTDDVEFVAVFAQEMMKCYCDILEKSLYKKLPISDQDREKQIEYHTLYLFQVLTLDRGTTSGLLIHNDNDIGIMGSIPGLVSRNLLKLWHHRMHDDPLAPLVAKIISVMPKADFVTVGDSMKQKLATVVRQFFTENPQALKYQAKGFTVTSTVANHGFNHVEN